MVITLTLQADASWVVTNTDCAAPAGRPAGPSAADVLAQVRRMVPRATMGIAPPGGVTLVNVQTVLWIDTPIHRSLGTVQLLGQPVTIDITIHHVDWDFGDGTTDTTTTPGTPYSETNPCHTAICPNYYGHIYRTTATAHLHASITWTGRYRIATQPWQDIPGTVTGPQSSATLTVRQARGVLVPNPAGH